MIIILGANGHVGSAVALELIKRNQPITVVLHKSDQEERWKKAGAEVAIADINDVTVLSDIFRKAEKAFVLNPPAPPSTDTVAVERKSVQSILQALELSGIQKVVAESTYGAQPGENAGDLNTLYELEQGLTQRKIPNIILRAAYYMSNWDMSLKTAEQEGVVHTLYPVDFKLPMVAPKDLGFYAANFLEQPVETKGLQYVEGPERYSADDVAAAFSEALSKPVKAVQTPPELWIDSLKKMGFSDKAAASMKLMTEITITGNYELTTTPNKGKISLIDYIKSLQS